MTERLPTERIVEILRDRICLLEYPPGSVLRESVLAREFGVSRTPIRAVLQQLAHGGLIESRDGVGTIVTNPGFAEIRDIYQLRLRVAELIGQMNPKPLLPEHQQVTERLKQRAQTLTHSFDISEYWRINHELHNLIACIIGNSALRQMWDLLYFQSARMWFRHAHADPSDVAASLVAELGEVCRAIAENDAIALGYIQRNYIAYGLRRLEAEARS